MQRQAISSPARGYADVQSGTDRAAMPAFVDRGPAAVTLRKLSDTMHDSPRMAAQRTLAEAMHTNPRAVAQRKLSHSLSAATAQRQEMANDEKLLQGKLAPLQRMASDIPRALTVQRVVYKNVVELKKAMTQSNEFTHLNPGEKESVAKEFPNWYSKTKGVRFSTTDFETVGALREAIDEMIDDVDAFTDFEGQGLTDRINETTEDKLLVGYRARGENRPQTTASMPFGGSTIGTQIGDGLYIAKDRDVAMEYAEQYVTQGMIGVVQEVYLNVAMIRKTVEIKGISVKEWWNQYDPGNNDAWDIVVAAISGKVGKIQYKVNPKNKESGLFEFRDVERVEN